MPTQTPQKRELFASALRKLFLGVFVGILGFVVITGVDPGKTAAASTNSTINFQARLETAAGAIAPDGDYNVEFKIYDSSSSGASSQGACSLNSSSDDCWWLETRTGANKVHVVNGYLSVNLGSVTPFGANIPWDQPLYLTMNIGGTGTPSWDGEMTPRLQLTAVPYAFKAGQLAQLNPSTGFESTLNLLQPTGGNQIFQIPDQGAAGTYNLLTTAAAAGSYIQNSTSLQTGANFNIDGTGKAATFNATNALQTAGVNRVDSSGNLINIGSISGSGTLQLSGTSGSSYIMSALGLGTTNPQAGSALTLANGSWISSVDAGGSSYINMFEVNSSNQIQVGAALNIDGGIVLPTDAGQLTFSDLPIDTSATAGTAESYTFRVGSGNVLTVYGEADGSGNLQNGRVAIGSSITPLFPLDVTGDINTSTGYRVGGVAGISPTACTGGNVLQNVAVVGGIITAGTCVANGGGSAPTLQNVYDNSSTSPLITLSASGKGLFIQDASTTVGGNLFAVQNNGGSTKYFAVTTGGASVSGVLGVSTGVQTPSIDTSGGGTLSVGASAATITVGNSSISQTITVGSTNSSSVTTIQGGASVTLGGVAATTYTIGTTSTTGTTTVGQSTATNTINLGTGAVTSSAVQTINIGTGATGSGSDLLNIGSSVGTGATNIQSANNITLNSASTAGGTIVKGISGSTAAFQVQDSSGAAAFLVDTTYANSNVATNLAINSSFESGTPGWLASGTGASIAKTTTRSLTYQGAAALAVTLGSGSGTGVQMRTTNISTGAPSSGTYSFGFYAMGSSALSGLAVSFVGGGGTCALNLTTVSASGFQYYHCTVTLTGAVTSITITSTTASQILYIDGVSLVNGSSALQAYGNGAVQIDGLITSPVAIQSSSNSTEAFQLQNSSGADLIVADTLNTRVGIGTNTPAYTLDVAGGINSTTGYNINGTAGLNLGTACTTGQYLQAMAVTGGIVTAGNCVTAGGGGSGITSIGTIDSEGTPSANGATIVSSTSLVLQSASNTAVGLVNLSAQTFKGAKTFSDLITGSAGATISGTFTTATASTSNLFNLGGLITDNCGIGGCGITFTGAAGGNSITLDNGAGDDDIRITASATRITGNSVGEASLIVTNSTTSNTQPTLVIVQGTTPGSGEDALQIRNSGSTVLSGFNNVGSLYFKNSTFTDTISPTTLTANQTITLPNASGTVCLQSSTTCGFVTSIGTFSSSSITNGGSITSGVLTLGAADSSGPGLLTNGTQTIAGGKTFTGNTLIQPAVDSATALQVKTHSGASVFSIDTTTYAGAGIGLFQLGSTALTSPFVSTSCNTFYSTCALFLGDGKGDQISFDQKNSQVGIYTTGGAVYSDTAGLTFGAPTIALGFASASQVINVGDYLTTATGNTATITVGTKSTGTGKDMVTIGSTNAASTTTLQAGTGGIVLTGTVSASSTINAVTGYKINGTAGLNLGTACSAGQFLQSMAVTGGIVTAGTCATPGGGTTTLQAAYTASVGGSTPEITLDATRNTLNIQGYSGQTSDLLDLSNSGGTVQFGVESNGTIDTGGDLNVSGSTSLADLNVTGTTSFTGSVNVHNSVTIDFSLDVAAGAEISNGLQLDNGGITQAGDIMDVTSIQNSSGDINIDPSSNSIIFGNSGNTITFTATGGLVASGTAQHTKYIKLTPEYAGAVLDAASDPSCTSANSGTMTSGYDGTNVESYYKWVSSASAQCYDVVVRVPIPADFGGWTTGTPVTLRTYSANTSTGTLAIDAKDTGNTAVSGCGYTGATPGSNSTWATTGSSCSLASGTYNPGGTMTLRIRMTGATASDVRAGTLTLSYQSKF